MITAWRRWLNQPLDSGKARWAFCVNQLATPGLGSLLAGRRFSGSLQLLLASTGFGLLLTWFVRVMIIYFSLLSWDVPPEQPDLRHGLWKAGAVLFGSAWLWSLVTSLSLLREARARAQRELLEAEIKPPVIGRSRPPG